MRWCAGCNLLVLLLVLVVVVLLVLVGERLDHGEGLARHLLADDLEHLVSKGVRVRVSA